MYIIKILLNHKNLYSVDLSQLTEFHADENEAARDKMYSLYNDKHCIKVLEQVFFPLKVIFGKLFYQMNISC